MTQPAAATKQLPIPPPELPVVTRVWSKPFLKEHGDAPIVWQFQGMHPLVPNFRIIRMYVIPGGAVEVFSWCVASDGKPDDVEGTRHTIPWQDVRFIEEVMDGPTFVAEIAEAETDEEEEDPEEPEPAPAAAGGDLRPLPLPEATPNNGAAGSS